MSDEREKINVQEPESEAERLAETTDDDDFEAHRLDIARVDVTKLDEEDIVDAGRVDQS